jgi:hypothetical protein
MLKLRPFEDISGIEAGWLKAKHHFAIGPYGNPAHKAVGNLTFSMTTRSRPTRDLASITTKISRSSATFAKAR